MSIRQRTEEAEKQTSLARIGTLFLLSRMSQAGDGAMLRANIVLLETNMRPPLKIADRPFRLCLNLDPKVRQGFQQPF